MTSVLFPARSARELVAPGGPAGVVLEEYGYQLAAADAALIRLATRAGLGPDLAGAAAVVATTRTVWTLLQANAVLYGPSGGLDIPAFAQMATRVATTELAVFARNGGAPFSIVPGGGR